MHAPHMSTPESFAEIAQAADVYLGGSIVVLNLRAAGPRDRRRMADFAAGLVYATGGELEPVADGFFVLRPAHRRQTRAAG